MMRCCDGRFLEVWGIPYHYNYHDLLCKGIYFVWTELSEMTGEAKGYNLKFVITSDNSAAFQVMTHFVLSISK